MAVASESIKIRYPLHGNRSGLELGVPTITELFRDEGLGSALEMVSADRPTIVSAGCSIGAEPDSALAYYNKHLFKGRAAVYGFDTSQPALCEAEQAEYKLVASCHPNPNADTKQLQDYGFEVRAGRNPYDVIASSMPVRKGHKIEFNQWDLTQGSPIENEADLVLVNNVLYWLSPEDATSFIHNVATMLKKHGVISLGVTGFAGMYMGPLNGKGRVVYGEWIGETSKLLEDAYGLKKVLLGYYDGQQTLLCR